MFTVSVLNSAIQTKRLNLIGTPSNSSMHKNTSTLVAKETAQPLCTALNSKFAQSKKNRKKKSSSSTQPCFKGAHDSF